MPFYRFLTWLVLVATSAAIAHAAAPFVLSVAGSGRATAYAPTNKIVTVGNRTHVTWLDSDATGFVNRIRTLDRTTGTWSPTWTLGPAQDNHGGAALTVDGEGYLHAAYYPHHEAMRYRRSLRPNDASAWTEEERFGQDLTYPVLLCAPDGTLLMTARRSYDGHQGYTPPPGSPPWEAELWRRPRGGSWERVGPLLSGRFAGYVQFAEAFWWGRNHRTLHLSCRIYETDYRGSGKLSTTVGYLVSHDGGTTWQHADGGAVTLPATADTVDVIARGDEGANVLTTGGLIADAKGTPHVLYSVVGRPVSRTWLAVPGQDGRWQKRELSAELPPSYEEWEWIAPGAITRTAGGRIVIVATLQRVPSGESWWGHSSNEVGQLWSDDGGRTYEFAQLGELDPDRPRWLPNVERATGHHVIPEGPGIIFTDGEAGTTNNTLLQNQVRWHVGGAP